MALRFFDGFDYYPSADLLLKWSTNTGAQLSTSQKRFGTGQCLQIPSTGNIVRIIDAQSTWIIGFAAIIPLIGGAGGAVGNIVDILSGTTRVAGLFVSQTGFISVLVYDNVGTAHTMCTGTFKINPPVWNWIEWKIQLGATVNVINTTVKVSCVADSSFTATSGGSTIAATTADRIRFLGPLNATYNYDDIYICDGTGSINNSFLGDVRVGTLRPSAAGYSTQWTPLSGTNFSSVNETTENSDTSYVASSTIGQIDSYALDDLPATATTVIAVQTIAVAKFVTSVNTFQTFARIGATNYSSSTFTPTSSYAFYQRLMETSPATSTTWTVSEINGMEVGLQLIA